MSFDLYNIGKKVKKMQGRHGEIEDLGKLESTISSGISRVEGKVNAFSGAKRDYSERIVAKFRNDIVDGCMVNLNQMARTTNYLDYKERVNPNGVKQILSEIDAAARNMKIVEKKFGVLDSLDAYLGNQAATSQNAAAPQNEGDKLPQRLMGAERKEKAEKRKTLAIACNSLGLNQPETAKAIGIASSQVFYIWNKQGLKTKDQQPPQEVREKMIKAIQEGMDIDRVRIRFLVAVEKKVEDETALVYDDAESGALDQATTTNGAAHGALVHKDHRIYLGEHQFVTRAFLEQQLNVPMSDLASGKDRMSIQKELLEKNLYTDGTKDAQVDVYGAMAELKKKLDALGIKGAADKMGAVSFYPIRKNSASPEFRMPVSEEQKVLAENAKAPVVPHIPYGFPHGDSSSSEIDFNDFSMKREFIDALSEEVMGNDTVTIMDAQIRVAVITKEGTAVDLGVVKEKTKKFIEATKPFRAIVSEWGLTVMKK